MDNWTIPRLQDAVRSFCEDRDWDQFHNPKDFAIGIITEAAELLELFRFQSEIESAQLLNDSPTRQEIQNELADVFFFLLRFAQRSEIDLVTALESKLARNAERYPVEEARGSNKKAPDL